MSNSKSADDLNALLDAAVDGIVLIDHTGIVQMFNRAAERLFGFTAIEVVGRNVTILMNEEDAGLHDTYLRQYLQTRVPRIIGRGRKVTARRKDGSTSSRPFCPSEWCWTAIRFASWDFSKTYLYAIASRKKPVDSRSVFGKCRTWPQSGRWLQVSRMS